jgi:hypothetical protein
MDARIPPVSSGHRGALILPRSAWRGLSGKLQLDRVHARLMSDIPELPTTLISKTHELVFIDLMLNCRSSRHYSALGKGMPSGVPFASSRASRL